MTKRERRTFTPEFKKQMVQLYQNEKTKRAIINEYDLTPSSLNRWINQDQTGASTLIWTEKVRSRTLDLKQMRSSNYDKARTPHLHARV